MVAHQTPPHPLLPTELDSHHDVNPPDDSAIALRMVADRVLLGRWVGGASTIAGRRVTDHDRARAQGGG